MQLFLDNILIFADLTKQNNNIDSLQMKTKTAMFNTTIARAFELFVNTQRDVCRLLDTYTQFSQLSRTIVPRTLNGVFTNVYNLFRSSGKFKNENKNKRTPGAVKKLADSSCTNVSRKIRELTRAFAQTSDFETILAPWESQRFKLGFPRTRNENVTTIRSIHLIHTKLFSSPLTFESIRFYVQRFLQDCFINSVRTTIIFVLLHR